MTVTKILAIHCVEIDEAVWNIHQINFKDNLWVESGNLVSYMIPLKVILLHRWRVTDFNQGLVDENQKSLLVLDTL